MSPVPKILVALAPALLLLSACAAPSSPAPEPTTDPEPIQVSSVDGEWVVTRTVTVDTTEAFGVGTVATRYLVLDASDCDDTACTGTMKSAATEDVYTGTLDASQYTTGTYSWDGTAFTITLDDDDLNCMGDDGSVLAEGLYTAKTSYDLAALDDDGETVSTATGTAHQQIVENDEIPESCPHGGDVDYDVTIDRN